MSGPISEPRQAKPSPSIRQIGSSTKRPHRKNISREHLRPKPCEQRTASIHHPFLVFSAPNSAPLYLPFRLSSLRCSANSASLYPEAREGCVRFSLLIGIGGVVAHSLLPHTRTCGSASDGSACATHH